MTQNTPSNAASHGWSDKVAFGLQREVQEVDFFQAIRRIEALTAQLPRVGHASRASQEAIRIRQASGMDFAPATIERIDSDRDGRAQLSQRFFGLLGPGGPLPLQFTEDVRHRSRHENDTALEAFLNIFQHRMATLFYRAWSSSRGAIQRDRPADDRFACYLGAISGVMPHLGSVSRKHESAGRMDVERENPSRGNDARLYFTGRVGSVHRNAEGLQAIVSSTFHEPARVRSFVLRWLRLQAEDRTKLTRVKSANGRGGCLGQSIVLGRTVPDRRSMIGLDLGPIEFDLFEDLLPGGASHEVLRESVRSYVGPGIDCRVRLILDHQTVPRMSLGRQGALGRNAWLHCKPPDADISDCEFVI